MATVRQVYDRVVDVLLEPNGLTLDLYTDEQFLLDVWQVVGDFMQRAGLVRCLVNLRVVAGQSEIGYPDYAMDVQDVMFDDRYLRRESGGSLDNREWQWRNQTAVRPERWHEDWLPVKTVQANPAPTMTGGLVDVTSAFYGCISSTNDENTLSISTYAPLYGTISSYSSAMYVEVPGRLLGTIGGMVSSTMNATLVSTLRPMKNEFSMDDVIDFLPDSFVGYIAYGVLAKVFSRDGETRDAARADYCATRFEEGIALATAISDESEQEAA